MPSDIRVIVLLAGAFAIGVLFNLLSCTIPFDDSNKFPVPNFAPLATVIFYVLAPVPNMLLGDCRSGLELDSRARSCKDIGLFLTGFFVTSGLALPMVLAHLGPRESIEGKVVDYGGISLGSMIMSVTGGLIVFGSVAFYSNYFAKKDQTFV